MASSDVVSKSTDDDYAAKILVVDDDAINLEVVSTQLRLHHYQVTAASGGQEALNILEHQDKPDLVLLDIMMPQITGFEVCERVRKLYPESALPIILLTAKNQLSDLVLGFESGANDYLVKPFSGQELLARIRNHIRVRDLTEEIMDRRERQTRIEMEMDAARAVQETLLFPTPSLPELESVVFYQSAEKTGGDWYSTFYDPTYDILYLLLGDVTGHGFPAALLTGVVCGAVRSHLYSTCESAPMNFQNRLLDLANVLNRVVRETGYREKKCITMGLLGIELSSGKVSYINAGHVPMYLVNSGTVRPYWEPGYAMGSEKNPEFQTQNFTVHQGDILFLYTDGLIENASSSGEKIKQRRLVKLLKDEPSAPDAIRDRVLDYGRGVWGDCPPEDDCTMVILKWHGETT